MRPIDVVSVEAAIDMGFTLNYVNRSDVVTSSTVAQWPYTKSLLIN